jgi:hypothetical protein
MRQNTFIISGMDLLGGGGCTPLALARGGAGGVAIFARYSNLSNSMMISEL